MTGSSKIIGHLSALSGRAWKGDGLLCRDILLVFVAEKQKCLFWITYDEQGIILMGSWKELLFRTG